ncbi:Uncharacterised protein [Brevundimonas vesicularis]|uniref:Uncharacterized protein n=1 Tax=Brevundimonas vesicularis TaxID=41276 RepID=A0A2X1BMR7_BREVE|nr:hypothetical protein [Brevundimonas vesicularis]SPU52054.1 Uncharacterised protein [Brevundimonas vesicularis]
MLEINGRLFMNAVMEIRRVQAIIEHSGSDEQRRENMDRRSRDILLRNTDDMVPSLQQLHARLSETSALRLREMLSNDDYFTWTDLTAAMADIESRLRDELDLVRIFVLSPAMAAYLLTGSDLCGPRITSHFPSVLFEMEEAAKCLAVLRPTASVFHSMRTLEIAISALAKFLGIPDPSKPSERNWGAMLHSIKGGMAKKYPGPSMPHSEGALIEGLYASLDAIRNPWRNATMHVENIYQPHEAEHILRCVNMLLLQMSNIFDEEGQPA